MPEQITSQFPFRELLEELSECPRKAYLFTGSESLDSLVGFINGLGFASNNGVTDAILERARDTTPRHYHNAPWWDLCRIIYDGEVNSDSNFGQPELLHVIGRLLKRSP